MAHDVITDNRVSNTMWMGVEREICGDGFSDWVWTNARTYLRDYPGPSGNIRVCVKSQLM